MTTPADQPDLIAWLRARLDEDEQTARACRYDHWEVHGPSSRSLMLSGASGPGSWSHLAEQRPTHDPRGEALIHAARHDPARVLAEVDAKRRILDELTTRRLDPNEPDGGWEAADAETDGMASSVVRLLALAYADRPGYRDEWRPA